MTPSTLSTQELESKNNVGKKQNDRQVGARVEDIAVGARSLGFYSWANQIEHRVATAATFLIVVKPRR